MRAAAKAHHLFWQQRSTQKDAAATRVIEAAENQGACHARRTNSAVIRAPASAATRRSNLLRNRGRVGCSPMVPPARQNLKKPCNHCIFPTSSPGGVGPSVKQWQNHSLNRCPYNR